jgi:hypothetical protein
MLDIPGSGVFGPVATKKSFAQRLGACEKMCTKARLLLLYLNLSTIND